MIVVDKKFKNIEFHTCSQIHFTVPLRVKAIVVDEVSLPEPELLAHLFRSLSSSLSLPDCDLSLPCGLDEFWGAEEVESLKIVSLKSSRGPVCVSFSSSVISKCRGRSPASCAPRWGWGA
jgi:hypothetical protein